MYYPVYKKRNNKHKVNNLVALPRESVSSSLDSFIVFMRGCQTTASIMISWRNTYIKVKVITINQYSTLLPGVPMESAHMRISQRSWRSYLATTRLGDEYYYEEYVYVVNRYTRYLQPNAQRSNKENFRIGQGNQGRNYDNYNREGEYVWDGNYNCDNINQGNYCYMNDGSIPHKIG